MKKAVSIKIQGMYAETGYFEENDVEGIVEFAKKAIERKIRAYPFADILVSINPVEENE